MNTPRTDEIAHHGYCESQYISRMTDLCRQFEHENARLSEDKRRLDGLEAIPHQLEIVCKQSRPKTEGLPTLREQIDFFLSNDPHQARPTNGRELAE